MSSLHPVGDENRFNNVQIYQKLFAEARDRYMKAENALEHILEEIPKEPKLPLMVKIKEIAIKGLEKD